MFYPPPPSSPPPLKNRSEVYTTVKWKNSDEILFKDIRNDGQDHRDSDTLVTCRALKPFDGSVAWFGYIRGNILVKTIK